MQQAIGGGRMGYEGIANQPIDDRIVLDHLRRQEVARYARQQSSSSRGSRRDITAWALTGLLLMIGGFALLAYQGIRYAWQLQSGSVMSAAAPRKLNIPISPLVGITAMFAGYVLIVREKD